MDILITDLTKFSSAKPDILCTAGISLSTGILVRPLPYFNKMYVVNEKIKPGSVINGIFTIKKDQVPPHVEDFFVKNLKNKGDAGGQVFFKVLENSLERSIASGFCIKHFNKKIPSDAPPSVSIITIEVKRIDIAIQTNKFDASKFIVSFTDADGVKYDYLPLVDFGLCKYFARNIQNISIFNAHIRSSQRIFVRIGVGREYQGSFWMQVNGVYTFPSAAQGVRDYV